MFACLEQDVTICLQKLSGSKVVWVCNIHAKCISQNGCLYIYLNLPSVFNPVNQTQTQWSDILTRWVLLEFPVNHIRNSFFALISSQLYILIDLFISSDEIICDLSETCQGTSFFSLRLYNIRCFTFPTYSYILNLSVSRIQNLK